MKRLRLLLMSCVLLLVVSGVGVAQKIVIWDYLQWRIDYYEQYAAEYMQLNPGIEIELQTVLQGEYVDKIKVAIVTGTAPAMFTGNPSWISDFAGALAPYPHDLFPPDQLSEQLLGYSQLLQDGSAYYYPVGIQGGLLFINEDHWDNAGIGAPPRTWQEALNIGRRTTKVVDGLTQVAGFFFSHGNKMMHDLFIDINYQHGGRVYRDGGKQVALDEIPGQDAVNLIADMYAAGVSGFGEPLFFTNGQHAMIYSFAWRQQQIAPVEDLRWTVAPIPTLTGEMHPSMMQMQYALGFAVPKYNSPEIIREAFKFIEWLYSNDELLLDINNRSGVLPTQRRLWTDPLVAENPVLRTLSQTLPYATTPGEVPQWMKDSLGQVRLAITAGDADPGITLREVARQINVMLEQEPLTWVAE